MVPEFLAVAASAEVSAARTASLTEQIQFLGRLPAGGFVDDGISMVDGLGLVPNHRHRRGARYAGPLEIADGCSAEVMRNAAGTTGGQARRFQVNPQAVAQASRRFELGRQT